MTIVKEANETTTGISLIPQGSVVEEEANQRHHG